MVPFRLADCAADAAAVVRHLGLAPATFVGYSMGGTIAQLIARDHRDAVSGIVLSGTSQHFQDPESVRVWRTMGALQLALAIAPRAAWQAGFRRAGIPTSPRTAWWLSELMRNLPRDMAEAGRELGRFDSRPWLGPVNVPAAVVVTSRDASVAPLHQRQLATALERRRIRGRDRSSRGHRAGGRSTTRPCLGGAGPRWPPVAQRSAAAART